MPNITIRERDLTLARYNIEQNEVVFVPGFVSANTPPSTEMPAEKQPVYCDSLTEFRAIFGTSAPSFLADQKYSDIPEGTEWAENAVPVGGVLFTAGTVDPGYKTAEMLLSMGIPVVYMRVNKNLGPIIGQGIYDDIPVLLDQTTYKVNDIYYAVDQGNYYIVEQDSETEDLKWELTNKNTILAGVTYLKTPEIVDMYDAMLGTADNDYLDSIFYSVADKGVYNIKYLTSGGYPTFELNHTTGKDSGVDNVLVATMLKVASDYEGEGRGDCIALIDHTCNAERTLAPKDSASVYGAVQEASVFMDESMSQFGAMFTPWCEYALSDGSRSIMAGSFGYLSALAESVSNNTNGLAIAGVNRGRPPRLIAPYLSSQVLTNRIADAYSSMDIAINAITEIKPYGYTIWGNRTLKQNSGKLTATSFLNIRNIINDIKKVSFSASRALMFEQNNEILWINFKAKVTPLLERLKTGYGIKNYNMQKLTDPTDRTKLTAKITIYPAYAVESFDITIELRDDDTN